MKRDTPKSRTGLEKDLGEKVHSDHLLPAIISPPTDLMKRLLALLFFVANPLHAVDLTLTSPLDYQVVQRSSPGRGLLRIAGELSEDVPADAAVQVRLVNNDKPTTWTQVNSVKGRKVIASYEAPAGGWLKMEVQVVHGGKQLALGSVAHVGIGEVFVIAGQSNSANHGQEKQTTKTQRVASFDGKAWRIANDPQPGASGGGGSFVPAFADAVAAKENVPVGIIACGIGATSVREWLPKGATFPNPPTLVSRVEQLPNGQWASKGAAYEAFSPPHTPSPRDVQCQLDPPHSKSNFLVVSSRAARRMCFMVCSH